MDSSDTRLNQIETMWSVVRRAHGDAGWRAARWYARATDGRKQIGRSMPHTIALVGGTGPEGRGLATRFALAGHRVAIGSREATRGVDAARELAERLAGHGVDLDQACVDRGHDDAGRAEGCDGR